MMEQQTTLSNNIVTVNNSSGTRPTLNTASKIHIPSHNRNVSLDSSISRIKGLNINVLPCSYENSCGIANSSISPGSHSLIGAVTDEAVSIASSSIVSSIKGASTSRGSSPASKKKLTSEPSGGTAGSGKRRSPLIARKAPIGSEASFSTPPSSRARFSSNDEEQPSMDERDLEGRAPPNLFNGSGDGVGGPEASSTPYKGSGEADDVDGSPSLSSPPNQQQKTKEVLDQLLAKIQKTTELIKDEQRVRDDNVNEYLKLSANADRLQLARIKTVFEKKNQKSATTIQHLQKKLDNYRRRKKEIEQHGIPSSHRQPKEVLRDVGHGLKSVGDNIRDGFSGFSGKKSLIGKPKEIAHLIKNKFGSADNIKELGEEERDEERNHHGSATLPPNSGLHPTTSSIALASKAPAGSGTVGSSGGGGSAGAGGGGSSGGGKIESEEGSECNSSITSGSISGGVNNAPLGAFASPQNHLGLTGFDVPIGASFIETMTQERKEMQEENAKLREEIEAIKQTLSTYVQHMETFEMEEKNRVERLEEQFNDLTELHQNEMENLRTAVKDHENMEEKLQYKNDENIRDLTEMVEGCQTKISTMEHQQAQQQQQFLTLEGLENSNARMLVVKLINILLTVLQVLLLVVGTMAGILTPLLQTKTRLVATAATCLFLFFAYLQLSEIRDAWHVLHTRAAEILS